MVEALADGQLLEPIHGCPPAPSIGRASQPCARGAVEALHGEVVKGAVDVAQRRATLGAIESGLDDGRLAGGHYTVRTLFLGLLLVSGNDAANTLARLGSPDGTLAGGLAAMNAEAKYLGADDTHAVDSNGLNAASFNAVLSADVVTTLALDAAPLTVTTARAGQNARIGGRAGHESSSVVPFTRR